MSPARTYSLARRTRARYALASSSSTRTMRSRSAQSEALAASLAQPPVLERGEEAARGWSQPARLEPSFGVEPQRRARLREQQARTAQGSRGDAVEQQRIALGEAGREAAQHRRRDVELADEKSARGGLTFGAC